MAKIKRSDLNGLPKLVDAQVLQTEINGSSGVYSLKKFLEHNCIRAFEDSNDFNGVFATKSYEFFKLMPENREINEALVKQLMNSYRDNGYKFPVIKVNEKLEIIDGQHRFRAAAQTKRPVYFMIFPGWSISDVITLNVNQKNWQNIDYLNSFLVRYDQGEQDYAGYFLMNKLIKKYDLTIANALHIISRQNSKEYKDAFKSGGLVFTQDMFLSACDKAEKIMELGEYHPLGAMKRNFIAACLFIFKQAGYEHDHMLKKLRMFPDKIKVLREASTMEVVSYLEVLTSVYDHKKNYENRINFDRKYRDYVSKR